jgi:hypothetical protein
MNLATNENASMIATTNMTTTVPLLPAEGLLYSPKPFFITIPPPPQQSVDENAETITEIAEITEPTTELTEQQLAEKLANDRATMIRNLPQPKTLAEFYQQLAEVDKIFPLPKKNKEEKEPVATPPPTKDGLLRLPKKESRESRAKRPATPKNKNDNDTVSALSQSSQNSEQNRINPVTIIDPETFEGTEKRYYNYAVDFFTNQCLESDVEVMFNIINNRTPISISFVEWFVMKYTKLHRVIYNVSNRYWVEDRFDVNISYHSQIESYGKDNFDPCRRNKKFYFCHGDKKMLTTVAQLIFFRWCFYYEIINYIVANIETIMAKKDSVTKYFKIRIKDTDSVLSTDGKKTNCGDERSSPSSTGSGSSSGLSRMSLEI